MFSWDEAMFFLFSKIWVEVEAAGGFDYGTRRRQEHEAPTATSAQQSCCERRNRASTGFGPAHIVDIVEPY